MFTRLKLFLINILFTKEADTMSKVCATLIIKGKMTFAEAPATLKEQVRQILIDLECEHLITE